MLSPHLQNSEIVEPSSVFSVKLFVRKFDNEILYAECNEDFIDSLHTFLVHPLEMACSLSNDNTIFGCVGNLCRSQCRGAASTSCNLPDFYICSTNKLLDYAHYYSVTYDVGFLSKNTRVAKSLGTLIGLSPKVATL